MTSILWLASCTTTPANNAPTVPRATAPDPYDAEGNLVIKPLHKNDVFLVPEDGVYLPFWYWRKVFNYIVDTQAAQDINSPEK